MTPIKNKENLEILKKKLTLVKKDILKATIEVPQNNTKIVLLIKLHEMYTIMYNNCVKIVRDENKELIFKKTVASILISNTFILKEIETKFLNISVIDGVEKLSCFKIIFEMKKIERKEFVREFARITKYLQDSNSRIKKLLES
jgi:hypothetical protein